MLKLSPKAQEAADILDEFDLDRFLPALQKVGVNRTDDCHLILDSMFLLDDNAEGLMSTHMDYDDLQSYILDRYGIYFATA